jgi:hypothetical protein
MVAMMDLTTQAQLARNRAQVILTQFQRQEVDDLNRLEGREVALERSEVARKRKECLLKLDERKKIAMLKNLEYVARVEDERLKEHLLMVQEAQQYHDKLEDYHSQVLELRSKALTSNNTIKRQAGIGTQQPERVDKKRKKQTADSSNDSVSIYVSNLPTNGSASEELMRALFGSYGSLRKIHFYVDKRTGELKGDALVIYNLEDEDRLMLTEAVCSQVCTVQIAPNICIYMYIYICTC